MAIFNITGARAPLKPMVFELDIIEPPAALILLINPDNLTLKFTPKVTPERVRWTTRRSSSYILHAHHDELDTLNATGKSALFYNNDGLTSANRHETIGWENIQKLLSIYRNNGMNFNKKPMQKGSSVIDSVGRVLITYDDVLYKGHFDSFSLNESAEKPFYLDFSFDFKVTRMINVRGQSNTVSRQRLATGTNSGF